MFGLFLVAATTAVVLDAHVYASVRGEAVGPVRWVATHIMSIGFLVPASALALTGAVIVSRRTRNTVGRVMLAAGATFGATALALGVSRASLGSAAGPAPLWAAVAHILDFPLSTVAILLALVGVPLLFPDGRLRPGTGGSWCGPRGCWSPSTPSGACSHRGSRSASSSSTAARTRLQTIVDRRFNRTGYDARQAVETFARDVRDEVDLDRLRRRTAETAATAVEPTHVSLRVAQERAEQ